jgi:hypothetical protein
VGRGGILDSPLVIRTLEVFENMLLIEVVAHGSISAGSAGIRGSTPRFLTRNLVKNHCRRIARGIQERLRENLARPPNRALRRKPRISRMTWMTRRNEKDKTRIAVEPS